MDQENLYNAHLQEIKNFYKEVELGTSGIQYIYKNLKNGKRLSQSLLKIKILEMFDARTFVHVDIADEKLKFFEQGGINRPIPENLKNFAPKDGFSWGGLSYKMDFWLVPLIQDFLSVENNILIIEDNEANPKDPWLQKYPDFSILNYKDDVYFCLFQEQNSGRIKRIFSLANSWTFIVMLTSLPRGKVLNDPKSLTREEIELLAERAEKIIVGAYDRENYIIAQIGKKPQE